MIAECLRTSRHKIPYATNKNVSPYTLYWKGWICDISFLFTIDINREEKGRTGLDGGGGQGPPIVDNPANRNKNENVYLKETY